LLETDIANGRIISLVYWRSGELFHCAAAVMREWRESGHSCIGSWDHA